MYETWKFTPEEKARSKYELVEKIAGIALDIVSAGGNPNKTSPGSRLEIGLWMESYVRQ